MEAGNRNISTIFNRANLLKVPHFQRAYVWDEEYWERFLDDMRYAGNADHSYFMGTVILKQQETAVHQPNVRTIIDGQQRLTTFLLFFKALFEKNETPDRFNEIFSRYDNGIILEHNYRDKIIFEKLIRGEILTDHEQKSLLGRCYRYFRNEILKDEINPNNLLSNISFVGVDLQYQEDEQQIFDTINSLGMRLTTAELLKNYLFKDDIESFIRDWRDVFEKDEDVINYWEQDVTVGRNKRSNLDLFLQSYLLIKILDPKYRVSTDDKERFFKIDSVFKSYKEFIEGYKLDKALVIGEIKSFAAAYKAAVRPTISEEEVSRDDSIARINLVIFGLDTVTIVPYLLYVVNNVADTKERELIFRYLEAYIIRRMVCRLTTKNYTNLFRSIINGGIDNVAKLKEVIERKEERINGMPSDADVIQGFHKSPLTNPQSKGILYLLECSIRSPKNATELKEFDEYSVEHVMPKKWRNKWSPAGSQGQEDRRDDLILTLGNLTIIPQNLNAAIRDSAWNIKKNGSGRHDGLLTYAQGIEIFQKYLQLTDWDEEQIEKRADELAKFANEQVWSVGQTGEPGESLDIDAPVATPAEGDTHQAVNDGEAADETEAAGIRTAQERIAALPSNVRAVYEQGFLDKVLSWADVGPGKKLKKYSVYNRGDDPFLWVRPQETQLRVYTLLTPDEAGSDKYRPYSDGSGYFILKNEADLAEALRLAKLSYEKRTWPE